MDKTGWLLELKGMVKEFPGVKAVDHVDLTLKRGEVLGLVGENGAGKSTLMKVILGSYKSDNGTMFLRGEPYEPLSPSDALEKGISMIHQELCLVRTMTVAENIWIGREKKFIKNGLIQKKKLEAETQRLLRETGIDLDPSAPVETLSLAQMQLVEILRAVSYNAEVIIMDEPTSSLTPKEVGLLYGIIRRVKATGTSIIFISHKLEELYEICDAITVLRDGKNVADRLGGNVQKEDLIRLIVGRELGNLYPKEEVSIGDELLRVENLTQDGVFRDVSFAVREGEILGFCGLVGAGRTEIMQTIFCMTPADSGNIYLCGEKLNNRTCADSIRCGIGMVTEDRFRSGFIKGMSIKENLVLANLDEYCKNGFVNIQQLTKAANEAAQRVDVRMSSIEQPAGLLSGGNQQKVIIGKWLLTHTRVMIFDEPTRGIDVGSKAEIYKIIGSLAKRGLGVLVVSSDLTELMGICDRIMVVAHGKITGELSRHEFDQERLMQFAFAAKS